MALRWALAMVADPKTRGDTSGSRVGMLGSARVTALVTAVRHQSSAGMFDVVNAGETLVLRLPTLARLFTFVLCDKPALGTAAQADLLATS